MLQYLRSACRMASIAGPTLVTKHGYYGNAILTSLCAPIVRRLDLSIPRCEPRGALDIELNFGVNPMRIIATHLGLRPGERRKQIRYLLQHIADIPTLPLVLMGDLNEWFLWGRPARWLHRNFQHTPSFPTFPARYPLLALDRIWVKPLSALSHVSVHSTALSRMASDHLPLKAAIDFSLTHNN
jgi:endonuclease/exonuclease/phosphatase family metal-dependent hydrolase